MDVMEYLKQNVDSNIFSNQEMRDSAKIGKLSEIKLDDLKEFKDHPFHVVEDVDMNDLIVSIKEHGVLEPAIAFWNEEGELELVAGHRRKYACKKLGLETMPVLIKDMDRDQAVIAMCSSNLLRRKNILPSDKARAYKFAMDAIKHMGKKSELFQKGETSRDRIAKEFNTSAKQISRFIQLNNLIPELMQLCDDERIGVNPAYEISKLPSKYQKFIYDYYLQEGVTPSLSQAKKFADLYKNESIKLDEEYIENELQKKKANQKTETIKVSKILVNIFFPGIDSQKDLEKQIVEIMTAATGLYEGEEYIRMQYPEDYEDKASGM